MSYRGDDIIFSEVLARVAFSLIVYDFRRNKPAYDEPTLGMYRLAVSLDRGGFRALSCWVAAAAFEITASGCSLANWRDRVILRARNHAANRRAGVPWRRSPNPRVTNRGVSTGVSLVRLPWGARKARFPNGPIT